MGEVDGKRIEVASNRDPFVYILCVIKFYKQKCNKKIQRYVRDFSMCIRLWR